MNAQLYFRHDSFRKGQKDIIRDIYESISLEKNILVHAPTGTGKTDSALSAAITLAIEKDLKVLFLTPKISQHKIALEVIEDLNDKYDLKIKAIDFVGKKNMCIEPVISKTDSNFYEICLMASKKKQCPFFENIRPSNKGQRDLLAYLLEKKLSEKNVLSHLEIKRIAEDLKSATGAPQPVCAYELAKLFAKSCRVIIADYYHVFSSKVAKATLTDIGIDLKDCIVIIDEAHNLEDRLLKLVSKSLNTNMLHRAIKEAKDIKNSKLKLVLEKQLDHIERIAESKLANSKEEGIEKDEILIKEIRDDILETIGELDGSGLEYIEKLKESSSALISVGVFLEEWIKEKEAHIRFIKKERNVISVKYNALDVSILTKEVFENLHSSVLMSATLTPLSMYKDIFNLKDTVTKEYTNPFEKERRLNLLITDTSTKYTQRNDIEYRKIAAHVEKCVNAIPGNCVVFFPSFEILGDIVPMLKVINKPKIVQEENMDSHDFDEMINGFKKHSKSLKGSVLFAVMGGKASEGIDLPGNLLIGAVIVGIPLAKMELETKAKIDYYEIKFKNGWNYAYIQPAIQKVIQSAGRVIRTDTDKGVIVFIDARFHWENYRKCFPKDMQFVISKDSQAEIGKFFENI
ncbi:MAG: ATP-dependent DNA helicase [Candidatus Pacearchaeota archaeon]|jgi:DNA excision repair protein ERCC-2